MFFLTDLLQKVSQWKNATSVGLIKIYSLDRIETDDLKCYGTSAIVGGYGQISWKRGMKKLFDADI